MPTFWIKLFVINSLLIAAIMVGLFPENPEGLAKQLGNGAFWWLTIIGWVKLAAGSLLVRESSEYRAEFLESVASLSFDAVQLRMNVATLVGSFVALLVACSGHPWLATLWIVGSFVVGTHAIDAKKKAAAAELAAEEDGETRPG